ncbi:hypothetical protein AS593_03675 [Caulobacter vibrioides]|nr:hypothetical protein AS593_03675 [Caulobacter vibrioides]
MSRPSAPSHPIYVYAPPYNAASAGIRALHILVDALNRAGEDAFVFTDVYTLGPQTAPDTLRAPTLTTETAKAHKAEGRRPIVVYPEVVSGNPLKASAVVRLVLNVPGLLGGAETYPDSELVYGYGQRLAEQIGHPDRSLFIPAIDLDEWTPGDGGPRTTVCYYASKYKEVHKAETFGLPDDAVEISRNLANSLQRDELVELLRRSRALYVFENTALAIEAPLCGCPAVMMPNPYLSYPIGDKDHGMGGISWGDAPEDVARATATVDQMRTGYQAAIDRFPESLAHFIKTARAFRDGIAENTIDLSALRAVTYERDAARYALDILPGRSGALLAIRKVADVVRRRGLWSVCKIALSVARIALNNALQSKTPKRR